MYRKGSTCLPMLEKTTQLRILQIFNRVVHPIEPRLVSDELELMRLVEIEQAFGAPATLTAESLLEGLLRRALVQISSRYRRITPPLQYDPPVSSSSDDLTMRRCSKIARLCPGRSYLLPGEKIFGDNRDGTFLTATMTTKSVRFQKEDLFNAFLSLDLKWTLRDHHFQLVQCLSDAEAAEWKSQIQPHQTQLSLYPSPRDRKKIFKFLETYGENFLPYPPDTSHPIASVFMDRFNAQRLRLWYPFEEFIHQPPLVFRTHWRFWIGWNYLVEFNYQNQTFARTVRCLTGQMLQCSAQDQGTQDVEPVKEALTALGRGLDGVKLGVFRGQDGAFTTDVDAHNALQQCYALLWETLPHYQATFRQCALPGCGIAFIPTRKDQVCCTRKHAARLRARRARTKPHR
jgi:hypothetical protein